MRYFYRVIAGVVLGMPAAGLVLGMLATPAYAHNRPYCDTPPRLRLTVYEQKRCFVYTPAIKNPKWRQRCDCLSKWLP